MGVHGACRGGLAVERQAPRRALVAHGARLLPVAGSGRGGVPSLGPNVLATDLRPAGLGSGAACEGGGQAAQQVASSTWRLGGSKGLWHQTE